MKKIAIVVFTIIQFANALEAQSLKSILKKATGNDSSTTNKADKLFGGLSKGSLSTDEVASGLKEALEVGVQNGTKKLSAVDGFFKDAAIKILLPAEAQKVEKSLRSVGLGSQVDDAILSMNRAAEDAAKSAAPIFINAIKQMSIQDAWGILKGGDTAATAYLRTTTTSPLTEAFRPVIETSLDKVNATQYWNTVFTTYNKMPLTTKIDPDLSAYVTEKALSGIFYQVALQEAQIRANPAARTTDILKKVFSN
jgi:hypothetical protein